VGNWSFDIPSTDFYTINGKVVGIIGLGKIGKQVAHLLSSFGAKILYFDTIRLSGEDEKGLGVTYTPLPDLLRESDIISLHVPIDASTRHLIGEKEFSLMKSNALLVNTCRGDVVDEQALIRVLQERRILGAALDVLSKEPPEMENPIRQMDNVVLTPHIAGRTRDTWPRRGNFAFKNMLRVWNGEPPLAVINN